jgi:DNA-binding CsgD family transcriptional regulator
MAPYCHWATGSMASGYQALTEKEKQTLRLLLTGHDAKSMARHLELSVHTVNERLRDARRKLSASSSREAARLLREAEGADPNNLGDKQIGDVADGPAVHQGDLPNEGSFANRRTIWAIGGFAMLSLVAAVLALSGTAETAQDGAAPKMEAARSSPVAESAVTGTARQWLALVDAGKWQESWAGTAKSFQSNNSVAAWESASVGGRVPLGRVLSRSLVSEENIPAPPHGAQLVRFHTSFENKPGATETLTLAREDGNWRIVGYFIE